MKVVERDLEDGAELYDADEPSASLAIREDRTRFTTLLWSSQFGVGEAVGAFESFIDSADPTAGTELTYVATNGYSQRTTDKVPLWMEELRSGSGSIANLRLECVVEGLGAVALTFNSAVPGMKLAESAISVTAESINQPCIRALYEESAVPEIADSFPEIAG